MSNIEVNLEVAKELGLTAEELEMAKNYLGRMPNFTELSIFSVMWSEHASYKNSIKWLKTLPREGDAIMVAAGEENAGLVDIGSGLACSFKIESHNHPSAVEPFQGAATGVGGINRDIFTMGARPVAQLNSLRFGNLDSERSKWHLSGVVKGIGSYGNAFGVPVVAGEVMFDDCYSQNPLVNAMSVGIMKKGRLIKALAGGVGNPVYIVGSSTGKDGIHGTTFASAELTENSADNIPSIQVGDPFQEKLLLEATLEVAKSGALVGMQDMGAAGIICSTSEMSEKGKCGMRIHLDKVPLRQQNMQPWEILLSESQERMLMVVKKGEEKVIEDIFEKWDLNCEIIGEVIENDQLEFFWHNKLVADVPASVLVLGGGAPIYDREYKEPAYFKKYKKFNIDTIPQPEDLTEIAEFMLQQPNVASKRWIYEQYDSMVGTANMSTNKPADAGIINLKGTNRALAVSVDCNARYVKADPEIGSAIAVSEAARNVVCAGAKPLAITNCLNFGNPYNPEVFWQFVGTIKGMSAACLKFNTPVTGGNVSFNNQSNIKGNIVPIDPTPTIGMLGLVEDKMHLMTMDFKDKGDLIYMIGESKNDISQSEYLINWHKVKESPAPWFDLDKEYEIQQTVHNLITKGLINAAHDVSLGGLYTTLIEMAIPAKLGFDITTDAEIREDAFLFGESQSRIIVSLTSKQEEEFIDFMIEQKTPFTIIGHVTKGDLRIDEARFGNINEASKLYMNAIGKLL
ncbi:MAG: phosphoribosylformylglycinamidine synthase subunit PurL [Salinivirgaceae bacterium]|nr:phosphoribosylformylglycinamidine synthase subunit PurL [Salinivirgaceae bacterium]